MTDQVGEAEPPRRPTSLWAACLSAAGLIVDIGARQAPEEAVAPSREDVAVVIAAAMYRQVQRRGLAASDADVEAIREVWILGPDGVNATLEVSAFRALEEAPDAAAGEGGEHRQQLLADGRSDHPDDRMRWGRVRQAAIHAARAAGQTVPTDADVPVRLTDVATIEHQRRLLDQMGEFWGDER